MPYEGLVLFGLGFSVALGCVGVTSTMVHTEPVNHGTYYLYRSVVEGSFVERPTRESQDEKNAIGIAPIRRLQSVVGVHIRRLAQYCCYCVSLYQVGCGGFTDDTLIEI